MIKIKQIYDVEILFKILKHPVYLRNMDLVHISQMKEIPWTKSFFNFTIVSENFIQIGLDIGDIYTEFQRSTFDFIWYQFIRKVWKISKKDLQQNSYIFLFYIWLPKFVEKWKVENVRCISPHFHGANIRQGSIFKWGHIFYWWAGQNKHLCQIWCIYSQCKCFDHNSTLTISHI